MIAAIFLIFVAALVACHMAFISDLLMVTIVLALLIVLVVTEPGSSEGEQALTRSQSVLAQSSPERFPAAPRIFAASRRRSLGLSRRNAFPAPADSCRRSLVATGSRSACQAEAVCPRRRTLAHAMAGTRFIN
jgi:hypothetical protein